MRRIILFPRWFILASVFLSIGIPAKVFAGAGTNGGGGPDTGQLTFDLVYGTFSLGGSNFDYLTTNAPLIMDDQGSDLLTAISLTTGLDPRVYTGITALLGSSTTPVTVTFPLTGCTPAPCTPSGGTFPVPAAQTVNNIAFSTGALGQISDVTDPSQILAEAALLHLISTGAPSTSTPAGSLSFTTTGDQLVGSLVEVVLLTSTVNLEELDFAATDVTAAAPEPSDLALVLISAVILPFANGKRYRMLVRAAKGDGHETN